MAIFEYINGFYNPRRRHSALGWKRHESGTGSLQTVRKRRRAVRKNLEIH